MLDFIGEFDENIYYQNERLYFFRKEYSSLNWMIYNITNYNHVNHIYYYVNY